MPAEFVLNTPLLEDRLSVAKLLQGRAKEGTFVCRRCELPFNIVRQYPQRYGVGKQLSYSPLCEDCHAEITTALG